MSRITGIQGNHLLLKDIKAEITIGESYREDLMEIDKEIHN
jgi:hypothetical protein